MKKSKHTLIKGPSGPFLWLSVGDKLGRAAQLRFFTFYAQQKALNVSSGLSALFDAWQCPTLAWGDPTLPSALRRF
ncbi:hypothetical protein, partial [Serratia marcescens]|uniref:hypothetical protein n=1 Tax=Serratia marcescens TaxID=615 RepID=UPI0032049756